MTYKEQNEEEERHRSRNGPRYRPRTVDPEMEPRGNHLKNLKHYKKKKKKLALKWKINLHFKVIFNYELLDRSVNV